MSRSLLVALVVVLAGCGRADADRVFTIHCQGVAQFDVSFDGVAWVDASGRRVKVPPHCLWIERKAAA